MLIILYILFFAAAGCIVAEKFNKEIAEIIPAVFSAFVLMLYILAFFNKMWFADYIVAAAIVLCAGVLLTGGKDRLHNCFKKLAHPSVIIFAAVLLIGIVALSERGIFSDDDWNFWATDVKTIFYLQGFSPSGFNTVPLYGDYPPASQLIEAWVMHINGQWNEGLLFSAYFMAIMVYTMPILKNIPARLFPVGLATAWMFFIYSIGPNMMFDISADILMGCVYGSVLLLAFYWKDKKMQDYCLLAIMLSVIVLMKSVGIQWVAFALVFIILSDKNNLKNIRIKSSFIMPVLVWLSWSIFCKTAHRTTYLTETLKNVSSPEFDTTIIQQIGADMASSFFKALFMQQQKAVAGIGLSIVAVFLITIAVLQIYKKSDIISRRENVYLTGFIAVSGIAEYSILLFSVLTMFINEPWYTQPEYMIILLKRYGAPFIISCILLVNGILFERIKERKISLPNTVNVKLNFKSIVVCSVVIIQMIFSPIGQEIEKYVTYRGDTYKELNTFNEAICQSDISTVSPELIKITDTINNTHNENVQKILVVHDETEFPHNEGSRRSLRYYCAPDAVELVSVTEGITVDELLKNNDYTSICFVTDKEDCSSFKDIYKSYADVKPYTLYEL